MQRQQKKMFKSLKPSSPRAGSALVSQTTVKCTAFELSRRWRKHWRLHSVTFNSCLITQLGSWCKVLKKNVTALIIVGLNCLDIELNFPLAIQWVTAVCRWCRGLAFKLPTLSYSCLFIKVSKPHKSWKRLCQCFYVVVFSFFFFLTIFFSCYTQYGSWSWGLSGSLESRTWKPSTRPALHKQAVPTSNGWQSCPISSPFTSNSQHG